MGEKNTVPWLIQDWVLDYAWLVTGKDIFSLYMLSLKDTPLSLKLHVK